MKIKIIEICEQIRLYQDDKRDESAFKWFEMMGFEETSGSDREELKKQLTKLKCKLNNCMKNCNRKWDVVKEKHQQWLDSDFNFEFRERADTFGKFKKYANDTTLKIFLLEPLVLKKRKTEPTSRKLFQEKGSYSQQRDILKVVKAADGCVNLLLRAACSAAKKKGEAKVTKAIEKILEDDLEQKTESSAVMAFHLDNKFSKAQYNNTRKFLLDQKISLLPSYYQLSKLKKECHPDDIAVSETIASVPVQALFNHTASRIIQHSSCSITSLMKERGFEEVSAELICSWGFDGSTGQSQYNMRIDGTDSSLFVTAAIPLALQSQELGEIWKNPAPASTRFVRPVRLEFTKETKELVLSTRDDIQRQIDEMQPFKVQLSEDLLVTVRAQFHLTLIDGKCLAFLTGTPSMASCPLCQAKPSALNSEKAQQEGKFAIKNGADQYGVSPLHFAIRVLEGLLKLSYRLEKKKWRVGDAINGRKKAVQANIKAVFAVIVDMPRDGGAGTSNTGSAARRLLSEPEKFAETLELDPQLVIDFRTIVIALNCQIDINPSKFQVVCDRIIETYRKLYPWADISSALHKVLYHGAHLIRVSPLPLGILSEEGAESKNKEYRSDRERHARKCGRTQNLTDVMLRSLEMSDPLISMFSASKRRVAIATRDLPSAVKELLQSSPEELEEDWSEEVEDLLIDIDEVELCDDSED